MSTAIASDYSIATQRLLTSIQAGTPPSNRNQLGPDVPLHLFQVLRLVALGSSVETMVGAGSPALVYQGGQALGMALGAIVYKGSGKDINAYLKILRDLCIKLRLGLVVLEKHDVSRNRLTLKVDECVSCAGISGVKAPICHYEAGMVGGVIKHFVSVESRPRTVKAIETRCNAVGDGTCGIDVEVLP